MAETIFLGLALMPEGFLLDESRVKLDHGSVIYGGASKSSVEKNQCNTKSRYVMAPLGHLLLPASLWKVDEPSLQRLLMKLFI